MEKGSLRISRIGCEAEIPLFKVSPISREDEACRPSEKSVFILAGQHGWEYTGILTAFELVRKLGNQEIRDEIAILPVSNPAATVSATRTNPVDGENLNAAYDSFPDPDTNDPASPSGILRRTIWQTALGYSRVVDLHSAGQARYLSHAIVVRESDVEEARLFGLPFVIRRSRGREGSGSTLTAAVYASGRRAFALELGAGCVVRRDDVNAGVRAVMRFLMSIGTIAGFEEHGSLTPMDQVFLHDVRTIVKARCRGIVWHRKALGEEVVEGEIISEVLSVQSWEPISIKSPVAGRIIYQRDHGLVAEGDTIAMLIPLSSADRQLKGRR